MIYCVEDDKNIRDLVIYRLQSTGMKVKALETEKRLKKR